VPTFAILNLPEWKCPAPGVMANMTYDDKTELWQLRMREVQGAIVVASVFQFAIGVFGMKLNLVLFPNLRLVYKEIIINSLKRDCWIDPAIHYSINYRSCYCYGRAVSIRGGGKHGRQTLGHFWTVIILIILKFLVHPNSYLFYRTIFLVIVFSQYLKNVKCPLPTFRKGQGWGVKKLDIFTLLPVDGSNCNKTK
jgi:nucleobase transporter 1/2